MIQFHILPFYFCFLVLHMHRPVSHQAPPAWHILFSQHSHLRLRITEQLMDGRECEACGVCERPMFSGEQVKAYLASGEGDFWVLQR